MADRNTLVTQFAVEAALAETLPAKKTRVTQFAPEVAMRASPQFGSQEKVLTVEYLAIADPIELSGEAILPLFTGFTTDTLIGNIATDGLPANTCLIVGHRPGSLTADGLPLITAYLKSGAQLAADALSGVVSASMVGSRVGTGDIAATAVLGTAKLKSGGRLTSVGLPSITMQASGYRVNQGTIQSQGLLGTAYIYANWKNGKVQCNGLPGNTAEIIGTTVPFGVIQCNGLPEITSLIVAFASQGNTIQADAVLGTCLIQGPNSTGGTIQVEGVLGTCEMIGSTSGDAFVLKHYRGI
jgi:hypothetical protein